MIFNSYNFNIVEVDWRIKRFFCEKIISTANSLLMELKAIFHW